MDVLDFAAGVSSGGSEIAFRLSERIGDAECAITREALEVHFWLPLGADCESHAEDVRRWSASDCRRAERKVRARPDQPVRLTGHDFITKR
jgi:hypothetical protein